MCSVVPGLGKAHRLLNTSRLSAQKRRFLCVEMLFAMLSSASAFTTLPPVLTNATWSGGQFHFMLQGEANVGYIIESSSDLSTWRPSMTNWDSHATRNITVPAVDAQTFWRVRPAPGPVIQHAIVARGGVILSGFGRIDSFNSTNELESTLGQYDSAKATDRALVGTNLRTPNAIDVGTMVVYGYAATAPGGTVRVAPAGSLGSKAWVESVMGKGLVEPGHHIDDANFYIPPAYLPSDFAPAALPQNVLYPTPGGTNYNYAVLTDGDYRHMGSLTLGTGQKMLIAARCRIMVMGTTTVESSGYILMGTNASVEFYCMGRVDIQGQGVINHAGYARDFSVFALSSQPVTYGGQTKLIGTIYAPLSSVTLSGTADAIGAIVCNSFRMIGTMGLHFDENLKRLGPVR